MTGKRVLTRRKEKKKKREKKEVEKENRKKGARERKKRELQSILRTPNRNSCQSDDGIQSCSSGTRSPTGHTHYHANQTLLPSTAPCPEPSSAAFPQPVQSSLKEHPTLPLKMTFRNSLLTGVSSS